MREGIASSLVGEDEYQLFLKHLIHLKKLLSWYRCALSIVTMCIKLHAHNNVAVFVKQCSLKCQIIKLI